MVIWRFTRVLFGSTASLFLLNVVLRKHLHSYDDIDPNFVNIVLSEIYVDDLIGRSHDDEPTYKFYKKCKAGLDLRKWSTNDVTLQKMINVPEKVDAISTPKNEEIDYRKWPEGRTRRYKRHINRSKTTIWGYFKAEVMSGKSSIIGPPPVIVWNPNPSNLQLHQIYLKAEFVVVIHSNRWELII